MAFGSNTQTYFQGTWHDGDVAIMRAADHGSWLGTTVFDGARQFEGVSPDLLAHCERVNNSARALMLEPTISAPEMVDITREGLATLPPDAAVYIRPMYWGVGALGSVVETDGSTEFALCLEVAAMPPADATTTLTRTRFCRPVMESSVVNAKAGCLYPNNARMLAEAKTKEYANALAADAEGNVAETATANVFMVKDGEIFTPVANGTFLAGITRARHIANLADEGIKVHESTLSFEDFDGADEVFVSGNMSKITPVTEFDGVNYQVGPVARRLRELYWDWALSDKG
ncbi:MAG: branched-chain amino acid aminotransferase [Boseongicola sp.]|nr:MAG: branched-chain amino acid aminotransferase [Boseongicola sp.]